jgi:hypothetical protein
MMSTLGTLKQCAAALMLFGTLDLVSASAAAPVSAPAPTPAATTPASHVFPPFAKSAEQLTEGLTCEEIEVCLSCVFCSFCWFHPGECQFLHLSGAEGKASPDSAWSKDSMVLVLLPLQEALSKRHTLCTIRACMAPACHSPQCITNC